MNDNLSLIRTNLARDRTFLASIRTNAIFAGLSLMLIKEDFKLASIIVLSFSIIANFIIIDRYLKSEENKSYRESSIVYSLILVLILCIMLYLAVMKYLK